MPRKYVPPPLPIVALRKESVDRNLLMWYQCNTVVKVALRKESVDRNTKFTPAVSAVNASLSARRAWIEIHYQSDARRSQGGRSPQGERG